MSWKYEIYIGSENGSKKLDEHYLLSVIDWASSCFPQGYTLVLGRGFYNGIVEDSAVLTVLSYNERLHSKAFESLRELKSKLRQQAILVTESPVQLEVV